MAGGMKTARVGLCRVSLGWSVKTALFYFIFSVENTAARSSRTVSLVVFCRPKAVS